MTSHWSLVGYGLGLTFAIVSAVRYWMLYPDLDKFIAYVVIGALILAVSWLYNQNLQTKNKLTAVEDYLAERK